MMIKAARDDGIEFSVPLHLLCPYFALDLLMPMKRLVNVSKLTVTTTDHDDRL